LNNQKINKGTILKPSLGLYEVPQIFWAVQPF